MPFLTNMKSAITVEPVMFLYMFGNFLYFPLLQSLIFDKICLATYDAEFCGHLKNDSHSSQYHYVNSETSHWILIVTIVLTVPSAVAVLLFYGALGDKIGRKVPVIIPCIGALAAYLSAMLNAHFMSASLYYLLIGVFLNGICGGFIALMMAVYSYVGQIASNESKMARISAVEASVFIAGTAGVFVSGIIYDGIGYQYTFLVLIACTCIAISYAVYFLDDVNVNVQTNENAEGCTNAIIAYFKESVQCVGKRRASRVFSSILLQVICIDVLMFATSGDMDVSFLYLREKLGYDQTLFGYFKGLDNFLRGATLIVIPQLAKRFFNISNFVMILVGIGSYVANMIVLAVASSKWMPFLAVTLGMFKGFPAAGLRSSMSSLVSKDEQGRTFGLVAATESIIGIIASLVYNTVYPKTYYMFPGLCFILAAVLLAFCFVLVIVIKARYPTSEEELDTSPRYETLDEAIIVDNNTISPLESHPI